MFNDNERIVIAGLAGGENISIYSLGGMLVTRTTVDSGMDTVNFNVPSDYYIVVVNDGSREVAVKIRH